MLQLLRNKKVEEAANLIWQASRKKKMVPKWDASMFLGHFQEVLSRLAISAGLRPLKATEIKTMTKDLEMIRDRELFFRKGPARKELERAILSLNHHKENTSKTKPKDLASRRGLQSLRQYFQDYLQKPLDKAAGLLMEAAFGGKWPAKTVGVRASEWAGWKDVFGLKKATAENTTKEAFAAIDKLEGEELEAAFEKMEPKWRKLYLDR